MRQKASPELNLSAKWGCFSVHRAKLLLGATAAAAAAAAAAAVEGPDPLDRSAASCRTAWEYDVAYVFSTRRAVWFQLRRHTSVEDSETVSQCSQAEAVQLPTACSAPDGDGATIDGDHIAGWATGAPRQRRAEPVAGFVSTTLVSPNASSARRGSAMPAAAGSGAGRMPTAKDVSQAPSASVPAPACANSAPPSASVKADGNSGTVGLAPLARPAAPTGMTSCSNIPALQLMLEPESEPEPGIPFCPVPLMVMEGGGAASGSSDSDSANIPSPQVRAKHNIYAMNAGMWT